MDLIQLYQEIIVGVVNGATDEMKRAATKAADKFFSSEPIMKLCRYWNGYIFSGRAEVDEIRNAIFLHLMEDDCRRFKLVNDTAALLGWINRTAVRYLIRHKGDFVPDWKPETVEEEQDNDEMTEKQIQRKTPDVSEATSEAHFDTERLLSAMNNARYVMVIRELCLSEREPADVADEMGITVANLYNIKKRALAALTKVALKDIKHYANK